MMKYLTYVVYAVLGTLIGVLLLYCLLLLRIGWVEDLADILCMMWAGEVCFGLDRFYGVALLFILFAIVGLFSGLWVGKKIEKRRVKTIT